MIPLFQVFKNLLILAIIIYHIYKFIGFNQVNMPLSVIEKSLTDNAILYNTIYIDEAYNTAYLQLNNNTLYKTLFSNHENFKELIKSLTGDHYKNLEINYYSPNSFTSTMYDIIWNVTLMYILFWIIESLIPQSSNKKTNDSGLLSIGLFSSKILDFCTIIKKSNTKFSDIIGLKSVKEDLTEFVKYIQFPKVYISNGCEIPRGLLFVGPPGVGKTLVAKAFASESNATFIYTTGSNFNEFLVGMGSKRMRQLFDYARKNIPSVIFIDEIDAIGYRGGSYEHTESNKTINALLAELDGMIEANGIMVIAATNLEKLLDPALTRSGRFDKKITFDLPILEERIELFKLYLSKITLDLSFNNETDIKFLASRTARLTGADIKNICNQGILNYMKKYKLKETMMKNKIVPFLEVPTTFNGCTLNDLNNAFDDITVGNLKTQKAMSEIEKIQTAYHEAGHTLISCLINKGEMRNVLDNIPLKVSIIARGDSLGFTQPTYTDKQLIFKRELIANICILLGGRAAEQIQFSDITTGASDDLQKASQLVNEYFSKYCFGDTICITVNKLYSQEYKTQLNSLVEKMLNKCYKFVCDTLNSNNKLLENIAEELLVKELLHNSDILKIIPEDKINSIKFDR